MIYIVTWTPFSVPQLLLSEKANHTYTCECILSTIVCNEFSIRSLKDL